MVDDTIYVLDASAIITFKRVIKPKDQWGFAKHLEDLVTSGSITFPRQVAREVGGQRHTDLPEAWTLGVERDIVIRREPDSHYVEEVMRTAGNVIEEYAENDPADPYVLALALQLWRESEARECYIVTEDVVDRLPLKISIRTACLRLGRNYMDTREFARDISFGHVLQARSK